MNVDVYRNLQDECISVRSRESENRGKVVDHDDRVIVRDAEFVVQPSGRRRVIEEERKNVHAFVRGVRDEHAAIPEVDGTEVTYNPYEHESFVTRKDTRPVSHASITVVSPSGVTAYEVRYAS